VGVVIAICLVITAFKSKIFQTSDIDWYPITILSLAAILLVINWVGGLYLYFSTKHDNYSATIFTVFLTAAFIL